MPFDRLERHRLRRRAGRVAIGSDGQSRDLVEPEPVEPERQARGISLQRSGPHPATGVPKHCEREHRGGAEDERHGRDRACREAPSAQRLRFVPPPARGLETGWCGYGESRLHSHGQRGHGSPENLERHARLLTEPQHLRVEPHLTSSPRHRRTSFSQRPECPATERCTATGLPGLADPMEPSDGARITRILHPMTTGESHRIEIGARLLDALEARDYDALAACFAPDATLRAIVPHGLREADGPEAIVERFRIWTEDVADFALDAREVTLFADLVRLRWVVYGIDPDGDAMPTVFEQTAYAETEGGRITQLRIACSGNRPTARR